MRHPPLALTLTGEYEADELIPVVASEIVDLWIAEAVDELTNH
jgi:hypothetical protein